MPSKPVRVFISYSPEDEQFRAALETHMVMLQRSGIVSVWNDRKILPGSDRSQEVDSNLEAADIVLLLVSPDFLASEYCYDVEMKRAMQRHAQGAAVVVPILVRHVHGWEQAPFGALKAIAAEKPIGRFPSGDERDFVWAGVVAEIGRIAEQTKAGQGEYAPALDAPAQTDVALAMDLSHQQERWDGLLEWARGFGLPIRCIRDGLTDNPVMSRCKVLILALPFHCLFTPGEVTYLERWVRSGGGLFLMGYYAADTHHLSNPSHLARVLGFEFRDDLVMPPGRSQDDCRRQVFSLDAQLAATVRATASHQILKGVSEVAFHSSCTIDASAASTPPCVALATLDGEIMQPQGPKEPEGWRRIIVQWKATQPRPELLLAASVHGKGRVVLAGSWKLCTLDHKDNQQLVKNICRWLGGESAP